MSEGGGIGALSAYLVPKTAGQLPPRVLFGKGAKESRNGFHSMYGALDRNSKKNKNEPGPGSYPLDKGFEQVNDRPPKWSMSKLGRDKAGGMGSNKVPGPGEYDKESFRATLPRIQFGKLLPPRVPWSQSSKSPGGPGSYQAKHPDPHVMGPTMSVKKTVARPA